MNITKEQIEEVRRALRAGHDACANDQRYTGLAAIDNALSILSALESESSPHVVAEPVAWQARIRWGDEMPWTDWQEIPKEAYDKNVASGRKNWEGRKLYAAPQQTAPVTEAESLSVADWVADFINRRAAVESEMLRAESADKEQLRKWALRLGVPSQYATPPLNTQDEVDADDYKTRLAILDENWFALKLAMHICDAVPSKAQEVDGPLKFIGELVNVGDKNGVNSYTLIRDAYKITDKYLKTVPPDSIEQTAKASAQFLEILERAKSIVDARSNLSKNAEKKPEESADAAVVSSVFGDLKGLLVSAAKMLERLDSERYCIPEKAFGGGDPGELAKAIRATLTRSDT